MSGPASALAFNNAYRTDYERPDVANAMEHLAQSRKSRAANGRKDTVTNAQVSLKFQDSLKIYCKTLSCQDPTSPVKGEKLAAMYGNMVQTQASVAMKEEIEKLRHQQSAAQMMQAASQVDNLVKVTANTFNHNPNEPCELGFRTTPAAKQASLIITNMAGQHIATIDQEDIKLDADGYMGIIWDGINSKKEKVAPGQYRFSVNVFDEKGESLRDEKGQPLEVQTTVLSQVTGGRMKEGNPHIRMSGQDYPMENIIAIESPRALQEYIRNREIAAAVATQAATETTPQDNKESQNTIQAAVTQETATTDNVTSVAQNIPAQAIPTVTPDNGLVEASEAVMDALQASSETTSITS